MEFVPIKKEQFGNIDELLFRKISHKIDGSFLYIPPEESGTVINRFRNVISNIFDNGDSDEGKKQIPFILCVQEFFKTCDEFIRYCKIVIRLPEVNGISIYIVIDRKRASQNGIYIVVTDEKKLDSFWKDQIHELTNVSYMKERYEYVKSKLSKGEELLDVEKNIMSIFDGINWGSPIIDSPNCSYSGNYEKELLQCYVIRDNYKYETICRSRSSFCDFGGDTISSIIRLRIISYLFDRYVINFTS